MTFGVSTHLFIGERLRREHLAAIAGHGFDAVELFAARTHFDYHDAAAIDALAGWLQDTGLRMTSMHAPAQMHSLDDARPVLDVTNRIPFATLVMHYSRELDVEQVCGLAEPLGVKVALEVMGTRVANISALLRVIEKDFEDVDVGICMDIGHAFLLGDPLDAIEAASEYLISTHLHDNRGQRDEHLVPFDGRIDWAAAMMAFRKIGYDGVLMFEVKSSDGAARVLERAAAARKRLEGFL